MEKMEVKTMYAKTYMGRSLSTLNVCKNIWALIFHLYKAQHLQDHDFTLIMLECFILIFDPYLIA